MVEPDQTWIWWNLGQTLTCLHLSRSASVWRFKKIHLRGVKIGRMGQIPGRFYYVFYEIGYSSNCSGIMQTVKFLLPGWNKTWRATVLAALHLLSANYMMWNSTGKLFWALIQPKRLTHQALLSRRSSSCRHCEAGRMYFMPHTCAYGFFQLLSQHMDTPARIRSLRHMMEGVLVVDIVVFPRREPSKEKVDQQNQWIESKFPHIQMKHIKDTSSLQVRSKPT